MRVRYNVLQTCELVLHSSDRSIVWLQTQRDAVLERQRAPGLSPRRDDSHEFRVGRLKHERVSVPRGDKLLDWAEQVLKVSFNLFDILQNANFKELFLNDFSF